MAVPTARETAWEFHETLVEILRHLNQAAERRGDLDGLELGELERTMARGDRPRRPLPAVVRALDVLRENRLVAEEHRPVYAWDRRRVLGERFRITPDGKAYLLRQVQSTERIL